jgi:hypothetical protein
MAILLATMALGNAVLLVTSDKGDRIGQALALFGAILCGGTALAMVSA